MSKINVKSRDMRVSPTVRLAAGAGMPAAVQGAEALLRRAVMTSLLWEELAFESGKQNAENIAALVPQVEPVTVAAIAREAREKQKLRHVPLFIAREMARYPAYRGLLGDLLPRLCTRADQITDFLALYWKSGKQPLAAQVKKGLANALRQQNAYGLAKWNRDNQVKLRDVLFMTHARPNPDQEETFRQLASKTLAAPDTWEVALSSGADKRATWERLITEGKIGGLAMSCATCATWKQVGVSHACHPAGAAGSRARCSCR
jgi:60 kDa SS-A/Ro ribonucleoprotein